ncbi:T9SS type A sorting domain-containing protein [uncultured Polaribacter sp.]|uniref:T9SS type A sorting domain-containing protein n=1 Tax=uncultured Polaribacter sp. TaxID=174711 RepID=UPI00262AA881|nr:T9SS type A sorting domain-containing protein [uncultured Polaribacter sp.]
MKINKKNSIILLIITLCISNLSWSQDEMKGKVMMGYQGWFLAKGDNSGPNEWRHWFRSTTNPSPENFTIDMWPDMSEYEKGYDTNMTYADGSTAQLFSSHDLSTTRTHFKWMKEYNIHGVHLQRFLSEVSDPRFFKARNNVLQNVIAASTEYDRHFSVMYDLSGVRDDGNMYDKLINDWEYLVDNYDILNQDGYVKEDGRPVVAIWGIGFKNRGLTVATFKKIIDYFHKDAAPKYQAYVMGGVPDGWRTLSGSSESASGWREIYNSLDMISPWAVGRYSNENAANVWKVTNIAPDLAECAKNNVDYMPVIWPGFSWLNLKREAGTFNQIPRNGGKFYWRQAFNAIDAGAKYIYVAMFDEVDEATAMFKTVETKSQNPVEATEILVPLDIDGVSLPSDWYLQLADQTQQMLEGSISLTSTIPIKPATSMGNGSEFVSQQNIPVIMAINETISVNITMRNSGRTTWTKASGYVLKSQNPAGNATWGLSKVDLLEGDAIAPNQEKIFTFNITSPAANCFKDFQWRIEQENVESFGAFTPNRLISVGTSGEYFDDCDFITGWESSKTSITTTDKIQGAAAIEFTGSNTDEFSKKFEGVYNAEGGVENTTLQFYYYVSDITKFQNDNQVEISSSGRADSEEYSWALKNLENGWNLIRLETKDASKIGTPDLSRINWFRLYRVKSGEVTTRIDGIQLLDKSLSVEGVSKDVFFEMYPNPTKSDVNIKFTLKKSAKVSVQLINVLGQTVSQKAQLQEFNSGTHHYKIPTKDLGKGIYIAKISIDGFVSSKRLVVQ